MYLDRHRGAIGTAKGVGGHQPHSEFHCAVRGVDVGMLRRGPHSRTAIPKVPLMAYRTEHGREGDLERGATTIRLGNETEVRLRVDDDALLNRTAATRPVAHGER